MTEMTDQGMFPSEEPGEPWQCTEAQWHCLIEAYASIMTLTRAAGIAGLDPARLEHWLTEHPERQAVLDRAFTAALAS